MNAAVVWKVLQRYCYFAVFQPYRLRHADHLKTLLVGLMVCLLPLGIANGQASDTFKLTLAIMPTGGGSISPAEGVYSLKRDSIIVLSALPTMGYQFDHWSGGVTDSLSPSTTVALDTNKTVVAHFSLVPAITIISPNGGEEWMQGTTHTLTWTTRGTVGNVKISFSSNGDANWTTLTENTPNDGTYDWIVQGNASVNCWIRIEAIPGSPSDRSDAPFTISQAPVDQRIGLATGWNIFSLNVVPENSGMRQIVQQLIDRGTLVKVQDEAGNTLERNPVSHAWVNRIGNWNPAEGYRIRMAGNDTLRVHGFPIVEPVAINMEAGWNIIAYPFSLAANATEILASLMGSGSLVKVQDESGNSIERPTPVSDWINNIGTLDPGEGYQIRVNSDFLLTFTPVLKSTPSGLQMQKDLHDFNFPR